MVVYRERNIDWVPFLFLTLTPIAAIVGMVFYFQYFELSWPIVVLAIFFWYATSASITAGYHRLWAHKSYKTKKWVEFLLLFFGAGAFQNSALKWCSDHRKHHKFVDSDRDPYSAKRGAFYSHIGWMFLKQPEALAEDYAADLEANRLIKHQHDHYSIWALVAGAVTPTVIGAMLGDIVGGFLFAGLVRMVGVHHVTFFVNSLAHIFGTQPYSEEHTAKDSFIVAILTNGEGYHNFHHTFEADYRNGIRWYQWDPTKWAIQVMSWFGQTYQLRRVPNYKILMSRMRLKQKQLQDKGVNVTKLELLEKKFEEAQKQLAQMKKEYQLKKAELKIQGQERLQEFRAEMKLAKAECKESLRLWKQTFSELNQLQAATA